MIFGAHLVIGIAYAGFYEDLTKNIFQLSFYTHLISSSENNHMESNRECHIK